MMAEFGGEGLKARAQTRIISEPLFLPQFKVLPKLATNFAHQPCYIKGAPAQNSYFKELIAVCVCGGKSLYGMQRCSSEVLIITILAKLLQLSCWKIWQRGWNCLKLSISFDNIQLAFEEYIDVHCPVMATALPLSHKMIFDFAIGPIYPNKTMPMVLWKFAIQRHVCFYQLYMQMQGEL